MNTVGQLPMSSSPRDHAFEYNQNYSQDLNDQHHSHGHNRSQYPGQGPNENLTQNHNQNMFTSKHSRTQSHQVHGTQVQHKRSMSVNVDFPPSSQGSIYGPMSPPLSSRSSTYRRPTHGNMTLSQFQSQLPPLVQNQTTQSYGQPSASPSPPTNNIKNISYPDSNQSNPYPRHRYTLSQSYGPPSNGISAPFSIPPPPPPKTGQTQGSPPLPASSSTSLHKSPTGFAFPPSKNAQTPQPVSLPQPQSQLISQVPTFSTSTGANTSGANTNIHNESISDSTCGSPISSSPSGIGISGVGFPMTSQTQAPHSHLHSQSHPPPHSQLPPPPPPSQKHSHAYQHSFSSSTGASSVGSSTAGTTPSTVASSSVYRKHSRKKSSQVIVPPIQVSRRRSVRQKHQLDEVHHHSSDPHSQSLSTSSSPIPEKPFSSTMSDEAFEAALKDLNSSRTRSTTKNGPDDDYTREKLARANSKDSGNLTSPRTQSEGEEEEQEDEEEEEEELYVDGSGKTRSSTVSVNTVVSGVTALVGAQFLSKILTFSLNHAVFRLVSPSVMGTNYQFEFVVNTILFFSREAVRLAAQRQTLSHKNPDPYRFEGGVVSGTRSGTIQQVINIGFMPILFGVPISVAILWIYHVFSGHSSGVPHMAYFTPAVILYGASCIIELVSEPSYLLAQLLSDFKIRASAETAAVFVRCTLTFLFVFLASRNAGLTDSYVIAFALGQLAYSLVLSGVFIYNAALVCRHQFYSMWKPCKVYSADNSVAFSSESASYVDPATSRLAMGMWLQTLFKHCLTEGDKLLVSVLLPISEQGVYALVANYGSLLARLCFLPIEDALRNYFSKLLTLDHHSTELSSSTNNIPVSPELASSPASPVTSVFKKATHAEEDSFLNKAQDHVASSIDSHDPAGADDTKSRSDSVSSKLSQASLQSHDGEKVVPVTSTHAAVADHHDPVTKQSVLVLSTILRCYIYLGYFASVFGPLCSEYILCLLVSSDWLISGASSVLSAYALYIPFLALNGSLEAFVQSVASVADLKRQGLVMIVFSIVFASVAYLTMRVFKMGAVGLVYANIFNMALRIAWSSVYIRGYYRSWDWAKKSMPKLSAISAGTLSAAVALRFGTVFNATELGQQVALAGITALVIVYCERELVMSAIRK